MYSRVPPAVMRKCIGDPFLLVRSHRSYGTDRTY
jgi:hypothetical protein